MGRSRCLKLKKQRKLNNKKDKNMATNGLQLAIHTTHPGSPIIVQGPNQNGQYSTWKGQADNNGVADTFNWWWKGDVIILDEAQQVKVTVPSSDPLNDYFHVYMS